MSNKSKIGIAALAIGAFLAGGLALNALDVDAFGWGFHKEMTPEEMQEYKEQCMEEGDCPYARMGHRGGFLRGFSDEVNHEVIILDNGVQITLTSDNPDIVEKLHNFTEKFNCLK